MRKLKSIYNGGREKQAKANCIRWMAVQMVVVVDLQDTLYLIHRSHMWEDIQGLYARVLFTFQPRANLLFLG